ncbi:MAG: DUF2281 domain-containing protein [Eubacterium sp.]|nr:DUF2281 domain-containing protein [Eubacterium sp.]
MNMTQQKAIKSIESLSEDQLQKLIIYIDTLLSGKTKRVEQSSEKNKKRKPGVLAGPVIMSEEFFETPDCFKP